MIFTSKEKYKQTFDSIDQWKIPETEKARLKIYIESYRSGDVTNQTTAKPEKNLERVLEFLKTPLLYFNKDIMSLTEQDTKNLFNGLMNDKIVSLKGKPIVMSSKKRICRTVATYFSYHNVSNEVIKPLLKKIKIIKETKDVITKEEFENDIIKSASRLWQHYLFLVLFWGGLRASEFLGLLLQDITIDEKSGYVKIYVRRENTKNDESERTVTLYGSDCAAVVKAYLEERKREGLTSHDFVFNVSYQAVKSWLNRLSIKKKRPLHFHLFRHSAATHLHKTVFKNNWRAFCDFFGWSYTSQTPARYSKRGGDSTIDVEVESTTIQEYKDEIYKKVASKDMEIEQNKKRIAELEFSFENLKAQIKKEMKQEMKQEILAEIER